MHLYSRRRGRQRGQQQQQRRREQRGAWGLGEPNVTSRAEAGVAPTGNSTGVSCASSSTRAICDDKGFPTPRASPLQYHLRSGMAHYGTEDRAIWHCSTWALQHPAAQQCPCGTVIVYVYANTPVNKRWGHRRTSCFETLVLGSHIRCHQQPSGALAFCQFRPRRACSNLIACFPSIATPPHRFRC